MDKQAFFDEISFSPYWVKTEEDFRIYCAHLRYRLSERKELSDFLDAELKNSISKEKYEEIDKKSNEILIKYSNWYREYRNL